jgi:hypothetical protein
MSATATAPVAARFIRTHEGYQHPTRLDAWERDVIGGLPTMQRPVWPGGSISGSDDGWDDCDE